MSCSRSCQLYAHPASHQHNPSSTTCTDGQGADLEHGLVVLPAGLQEILLPQIASWFAMWVSGLVICYGLRKKEQLRARLAASGQVWTAHEGAARELMSLELEDMQQQVDKMSNDELAQVAMRMMEVSRQQQPQQACLHAQLACGLCSLLGNHLKAAHTCMCILQ